MAHYNNNILILGAPGSGKSTMGRILASCLQPGRHMFVDMSRVCKIAGQFIPGFGNQFAACSSKGELVPDEELMPHFRTYMDTIDPGDRVVVSGIFRTPQQVHWIHENVPLFRDGGIPLTVVRVRLDPEDAVRRCQKRAAAAKAAGQTPRPTDLNDELNRNRVTLYEQHVEPVVVALQQLYHDLQVIDVPSMEDPHDTFLNLSKKVSDKPSDWFIRLAA